MRRTLNCVVCGKPATNHTGHVHLTETKVIASGLCDDHLNHDRDNTTYGCRAGCDGEYKDWMRDSKKETQEDLWALVDRQSLQQSKDQFILRRKP